MNVWVLNAIVVEPMALIGCVGVALTKRTKIAFLTGFNTMLLSTAVYVLTAPPLNLRQIIVLVMVVLYLLHMNWLLFAVEKRTAIGKLDSHMQLVSKCLLAILLANTAGWIYCLPLYFASRLTSPPGWLFGAGIVVYVIGTVVHVGSDYQKHRFKANVESEGKVLDRGFWSLCRHPNYFGDFLCYVAFALVGESVWGWISPLVNISQYFMDAIPKNERWASERYGEAWQDYAGRTKKFFPFIY